MKTLTRTKVAVATAAALVVVPVTGLPAISAEGGQSLDTPALESTTTFHTFSTAFDRGTRVAISDHGNLLSYISPNIPGATYDHLGAGTLSEGYVLCYTPAGGSTQRAYDMAGFESGFGPATASLSGGGVKIVRDTVDGRLQLEQLIFFGAKNKSISIQMSVKNLTTEDINRVILGRQADLDVDTGGAQGWANFSNNFAVTSPDSVVAWNDPATAPAGSESHGMTMKHRGKSGGTLGYEAIITSDILDNTCNPASAGTLVTAADRGARLNYELGDMGRGKLRYVQMIYWRH